MSTAVYRGMDAATVASEYQPALHVPSLQHWLDVYATEGAAARTAHPHTRLTYGPHPDAWLWYVPGPQPGAPLVVFIHGGYWRRLSADDGSFAAPHAQHHGYAYASLNYTLCPAAPLAELVAQTQRALQMLHDRAAELGHDPARTVVSGHSAGAHLAAQAILAAPDGPPVAGLVLVSGVFDIEPIIHTPINDDVHLDHATAARLSPQRHLRPHPARCLVTWGADETAEFARQSTEFAQGWTAQPGNLPATLLPVPGRHHFDVVLDLLRPGTVLGEATVALITALG